MLLVPPSALFDDRITPFAQIPKPTSHCNYLHVAFLAEPQSAGAFGSSNHDVDDTGEDQEPRKGFGDRHAIGPQI